MGDSKMKLRNVRRVVSVLLIVVLLAVGIAPAAFASVSARVNSSKARAYLLPSTRSASIRVSKYLKVDVTGIAGKWARVKRNGVTAYMPLKWLSAVNKVPAYTTGPTTVYGKTLEPIAQVATGIGVYAFGTIGNYYLVKNPYNGKYGYIASGKLSKANIASGEKVNSSSGSKATLDRPDVEASEYELIEEMLAYADSLVRTPYSKLNCSAFILKCLNYVGLSAKDTAKKQAGDSRYEFVAELSDLERGDIICFDTSRNGVVDHTAFYLGEGWFIDASRIAGRVNYNYFTEFYKLAFVCGRRIPAEYLY